jgi:hypothetical protein
VEWTDELLSSNYLERLGAVCCVAWRDDARVLEGLSGLVRADLDSDSVVRLLGLS